MPGIRSRNLTPFPHAAPILGLKNGLDSGSVFLTDRARIFVLGACESGGCIGVGLGEMDWGRDGWGEDESIGPG